MKINVQAANKAVAEKKAQRVVLPKGRYVAKLIDVEDKEGNDQARALIVQARVQTQKVENTPDTLKQSWRINYQNKDGSMNVWGTATAMSLLKATGVELGEADKDGNVAVPVDEIEGWVEVYLGIEAAREYINAQGNAATQPERNKAREFFPHDRKAAKAEQAEYARAAIENPAPTAGLPDQRSQDQSEPDMSEAPPF